jgi:hypothetical protein
LFRHAETNGELYVVLGAFFLEGAGFDKFEALMRTD